MKKTVRGTREWASSSVNVMSGCSHDCRYCYARTSASRFKTHPGDWTAEVVRPQAATKQFGKRSGTVMFPTQHDITPGNMEHTLPVQGRLLKAGNTVLVVMKPHPEVVRHVAPLLF